MLAMAFSAMFYSVIRFIEAIALWLHRQWAEWFGLLTGGMYMPVEMFEIMRAATWPDGIPQSSTDGFRPSVSPDRHNGQEVSCCSVQWRLLSFLKKFPMGPFALIRKQRDKGFW